MKLQINRDNDTLVVVNITADQDEINKIKAKVLSKLAKNIKVAGFRVGKVPAEVAEKNLDDYTLQTEFLNEAINTMYVGAIKEEKLRPVAQPKAEVKKFVPYTTLELQFDVEVVGAIKIPSYKKFKATRGKTEVTKAEIDKVIKNLRERLAEPTEVERAAKLDDEAVLDFSGVDKKGDVIDGADGTDYPLVLGSASFIPGFEENIVGMKKAETKTFKVTFPKDYGAKPLQNAEVTFTVILKKVNERALPKLDDEFAKKIGPFTSLDQLTTDIKAQLSTENDQRIERDYESAILQELVDQTEVSLPKSIIDEQKEMVIEELTRNVMSKGSTMHEYYEAQITTEEKYLEDEIIPEAIRRIKAGLLLSEIADKEAIDVTDEEMNIRIEQLKVQYKDPSMQAELDKPDNQREIKARMRSEKVIDFLKNQPSKVSNPKTQ